MTAMTTISTELHFGPLRGSRGATFLVEGRKGPELEDAKVTMEAHAYNSASTEENEDCLFDIDLTAFGEEREKTDERPYLGSHFIRVSVSLGKVEARALRDNLNAFLEFV